MSISLKVEFSERFHKIVGADIARIADNALTRTIVEADSICQQEAPVITATLRRSIGTSHPNMGTVCLTCGVKYWVHVQYGTAAHTITGNPLLAWTDKSGQKHFAKSVNHPGSKADPFVTRTAKQIKSKQVFQRNFYDMLIQEGIIR